eukprot:gene5313-8931_t
MHSEIVNLTNKFGLLEKIVNLDLASVGGISQRMSKDVIEEMIKKKDFSRDTLDKLRKHTKGKGKGKEGKKAKERIITYLKDLLLTDIKHCAELLKFPLIQTIENSNFNSDEEDENFEPIEDKDEDEDYSKSIDEEEKTFTQETFEELEKIKSQKIKELMDYYFGITDSYKKGKSPLFAKRTENLENKIMSAGNPHRNEVLQKENDPWYNIQATNELIDIILKVRKNSGYFEENRDVSSSALKTMICGHQKNYESLIYHWVHLKTGNHTLG